MSKISRDQIRGAIEFLEQHTVNATGAAKLFGVSRKFFYRLLKEDKFNLQSFIIGGKLFNEVRFPTGELNEVANIYKSQRKSVTKSEAG